MTKILIIGGSFRNKGAEAMVLTCVRELHTRHPQAEIVVASYVSTSDVPFGMHVASGDPKETFLLIPTGKSPARPLRLLAARLLPASIRTLALRGDEYLQHFAQSTFVVDVSGFALSDQRSLLRQLVYAFEVFAADSLGVPFVALTQAIGPFGERTSRIIANYCVRRMAMLFVRGSESARHLAELHADPSGNAIRCSDIAYLFEPAQREQAEALLPRREAGHPLVGIVPNVNVYLRTSPRGKANPYVRGLAALCNDVTERLHGQVVVVCHESHDRPEKDDRALADLVRGSCRNPAAVHVIPPCHPAAVLKATLRELDFVVASRFHSLVASISLARPFLAVGWSHKYQELVDETGMVGVMLDGRELEPDVLVKQFQSAWERREELQKSLDDVVGGLRASAAKPFDYLQEQWFPTRPTGSVVLE